MELKDYTTEELRKELKRRNAEENYTPDYWTRLEHQYAGMAMQRLVHLVNIGYEYVYEETAIIALNFAHALVEKMKEERK